MTSCLVAAVCSVALLGLRSPCPAELANKGIAVLPSERAQYSAIIDGILANSDLNTISARRIRGELEARLGVDVSDKKVRQFPGAAFRSTLHYVPSHLASSGCILVVLLYGHNQLLICYACRMQ
jgi:hypothetical protein